MYPSPTKYKTMNKIRKEYNGGQTIWSQRMVK